MSKAVASLVLGIVWLFWLGSLLAVIFGHIAISQINKAQGAMSGKGMAVAGLVLGYIGVATFILLFLLPILLTFSGQRVDDVFKSIGDTLIDPN